MRTLGAAAFMLFAGAAARAAAFSAAAAGTTGAQFLEMPVSARAVAMGEAQAAAGADAAAMYYNPARLLAVRGASAVFTRAAYLQQLTQDYGAVARDLDSDHALGLSVQHLGYGSFDRVDNSGVATGEAVSPEDLAVTGAYAQSLGGIALGGGLKYISSQLSSSASTLACDFGAAVSTAGRSASVSIANLGRGLRFRQQTSPLPTTIRVGSALSMGPVLLAADAALPRGARPLLGTGVEYAFAGHGESHLAVRAGFNTRAAFNQLGGMSGFAFGLGLGVRALQVDYAMADFGDLGLTHRVTIGWRWTRGD